MSRFSRSPGWNLSDELGDVYDATRELPQPQSEPGADKDYDQPAPTVEAAPCRQAVAPAAIGVLAAVLTCVLAPSPVATRAPSDMEFVLGAR